MGTEPAAAVVHRITVVAHDCRGDLACGEGVSSAARRAATASGLTLVAETMFAYVPQGLSVALLLAQSHLVISTWPEHRTATVDLAVCADQHAARAAWSELNRYLQPMTVEAWAQTVSLISTVNGDRGT